MGDFLTNSDSKSKTINVFKLRDAYKETRFKVLIIKKCLLKINYTI